MIRYYLAGCSQMAAAQYQHPALARLKGRGPWAITAEPGGVMLQRGESAAWGPIQQGLEGLRYQLADPLPPLMQSITIDDKGPIAWVDLPDARLPVLLAEYAEVRFDLHGNTEGPCTDYGLTASRLWERQEQKDLIVGDPELVAFTRLALMQQTNLTAELIHAYGLLTTKTVPRIFAAVTGCDPKKAATLDGGG